MRAPPRASHHRAVLEAVKDACGAAHAVASLRAALLDGLCARRALFFVAGTEKLTAAEQRN